MSTGRLKGWAAIRWAVSLIGMAGIIVCMFGLISLGWAPAKVLPGLVMSVAAAAMPFLHYTMRGGLGLQIAGALFLFGLLWLETVLGYGLYDRLATLAMVAPIILIKQTARLFGNRPAALGTMMVVLAVAPLGLNDYLVAVCMNIMFLALVGQSWNLMLGFAGLLSIGHALFVGVGAYIAGVLFARLGIPPVIGVFAAVGGAVLVGAMIGYLGFRFSIGGVYFALLTIAFAEFTRILIAESSFLGGAEGLFLKVSSRQGIDLVNLRGSQEMFYYLLFILAFATLALCRWLLRSKIGYYWQAIRDDQDAAEALGVNTFRYRMYAVMISSGIAGIAGVWNVFYYNNLFPDTVLNIERSIEYTLAPIVGGVGTLFGPIFGAFVLTPLSEGITELIDLLKHLNVIDPRLKLNGVKLLFWGLVVAAIVLFRPAGLWPWARDRLGLAARPASAGRQEAKE